MGPSQSYQKGSGASREPRSSHSNNALMRTRDGRRELMKSAGRQVLTNALSFLDGPLLHQDKPWRKTEVGWTLSDKDKLKLEVSGYKPPKHLEVPQVNILLVGQIGAGKSSFCNTVNSAFCGYVSAKAPSGVLTKQFRRYQFKDSSGDLMCFRLCDTMGLNHDDTIGTISLPRLLEGTLEDGYQFSQNEPVTLGEDGHKKSIPLLKDKMHVVAIVIDGSTIPLSDALLNKIEVLRTSTSQKVVLMSHVDKIDHLVSEDITNTYLSTGVRDAMEEVSKQTGIPMSYIVPIKNYERETELELGIDILALTALRQMLRFADDYFEELSNTHGKASHQATDADYQGRECCIDTTK